jgi:hypothetical protein
MWARRDGSTTVPRLAGGTGNDIRRMRSHSSTDSPSLHRKRPPPLRQEINTAVRGTNDNVVTVRAVFSLRDSSGNFGDSYDGFIDVVVVTDLE